MSAKEHKFQFQFSTNTHRELARFMFATYLLLVASWFLLVPRFGIDGLLSAWLLTEFIQVLYIMRLNTASSPTTRRSTASTPIRLTLASLAILAATVAVLPRTAHLPLYQQGAIAIAAGIAILTLDIPLFNLLPLVPNLRILYTAVLADPTAFSPLHYCFTAARPTVLLHPQIVDRIRNKSRLQLRCHPHKLAARHHLVQDELRLIRRQVHSLSSRIVRTIPSNTSSVNVNPSASQAP